MSPTHISCLVFGSDGHFSPRCPDAVRCGPVSCGLWLSAAPAARLSRLPVFVPALAALRRILSSIPAKSGLQSFHFLRDTDKCFCEFKGVLLFSTLRPPLLRVACRIVPGALFVMTSPIFGAGSVFLVRISINGVGGSSGALSLSPVAGRFFLTRLKWGQWLAAPSPCRVLGFQDLSAFGDSTSRGGRTILSHLLV